VSEDWAAVAKAINARVIELGWRQRELAERSHVSQAIVRELQHHVIERRRSARTLEALSTAMGWNPGHLHAVLHGRAPADPGDDSDQSGPDLATRLDAFERRLDEIAVRLADLQADIGTVVEHIRPGR
jgi:transcriptional regulator with XRE-family HTH domain